MSAREVKDAYERIARDFATRCYVPWRCAMEILGRLPGGLILDAGCGAARHALLAAMMGFLAVGVDISLSLLREARRAAARLMVSDRVDFVLADVRHLPFKDEAFDGVMCIAVIHHIAPYVERRRAVVELTRVLRRGGLLLITAWSLWGLGRLIKAVLSKLRNPRGTEFGDVIVRWGRRRRIPRFYHLFTMRELRRLVLEAKLNVIRSYGERRRLLLFPQNLVVVAVKDADARQG